MVETEVENILTEIRERVRSTPAPQAASLALNGSERSALDVPRQAGSAETLALINSYLATTARAWDRLPPVVSNRHGLPAQLELWFKRHLKRATRWYAWEQINFNAAVHQALRDLLPVLADHDRTLRATSAEREQAAREREQREEDSRTLQTTVQAMRAQTEAQRIRGDAEIERLHARFSELVTKLLEREDDLVGEQRVSFKQLSLEAGEAAVLEERARRKTESILADLQRRIAQLETNKDVINR